MAKYTKLEVLYEHPAKGMDHCKNCIHFEAPKHCEIVEGIIHPEDWCKKFERINMRKHKFHKMTVENHKDGSHTIHHHHEDGEAHDVRHAAMGLDHLHDSIQDHLGEANPGEAEANAGQHGVEPGAAAAAGLPVAGA